MGDLGRVLRRNIIAGLLAFWLGSAFIVGLVFGEVMPALNWKGQVYIGLTWPVALTCHEALNDSCSVVPPQRYSQYLFTFEDELHHD